MKKQEVNIVKAAVQRSAKLDQGMKVELGLTDKKEQQRLNKTFKPFAADPIVKKAVKGKSFAQWVGRIELLDGEQLSVLQADRFGKRMVYLLPSDETGELTTLPESTFTPEQVKELLLTKYRFETQNEQTAAWLNQLVHKLTMRKDSLRWTQESETVFTLGPAEGAVDVITLPLEAEPVLLALHELDTVAQMVRVCVTSTICNCFFQGVGSFLDSMKEDDQYKGYTEGALWRLNLVGVLPTIVLGEQRAKAIIAELEMLDGFFWRSADKAE